MKTKKKPIQTKSINTIKLLNVKTLEQQKNTNSTHQKTFPTVEQNTKTHQNTNYQSGRLSLKARFSFNKKSYIERMQQNNLSPFSNDGRSCSPKFRKTPQKILSARQDKETKFALNLKQFEKKKPKNKVTSARQPRQTGPNNNKKSLVTNKTVANNQIKKKVPLKKKPQKEDKKQKQQKARIQFQNQFLNMMNNRIHKQKITEISDEQLQCSINKKPKLSIAIESSESNSQEQKSINSDKRDIVKTMKLKIMKNINREYPNLDHSQKKVMSAIIIIQRLWRQRKVKQFFQHYLTPRASLQSSVRESLQKQISSNRSTMNLLSSHMLKKPQQSHSCQNAPKKKATKKLQSSDQNTFLIRQHSSESVVKESSSQNKSSVSQKQSKLNQRVKKLLQDSILCFENQNEKIVNETSKQLDRPSMIKFVQCYRQVKLSKKGTNKKRNNIFSLKQSLSQKCLMQKYYQRIFADKPQKDKPKNYQLFALSNHSKLGNESLKHNQQSSIELFKEINENPDYISPQKLLKKEQQSEEEEWVRNETTYSQETDSQQLVNKKDHIVVVEKLQKQNLVVDADEIREKDNFQKIDVKQSEVKEILPKEQILRVEPTTVQLQLQHPPSQQHPISTSIQVKSKEQYSLRSIQSTADSIMQQLMNEFFKEYISFQQKQCLVKKRKQKQQPKPKKPSLPGIQITPTSITHYLNILIPYILTKDRQEILKSLQLFHPSTYQKCHRVESPIYELFQFAEEEEDDIYWNVISNEGFFSCLEKFWQQHVTLNKENEKFTNFIDLTYKVYNRCITDAFSQIFNKLVLEKTPYPWKSLNKARNNLIFDRDTKSILNQEQIEQMTLEVKQRLLRQSFCYSSTGGKLIKREKKHKKQVKQFEFGQKTQEQLILEKLSEEEFGKIMRIANDEYLQDEKELVECVDERYELCCDISEAIIVQLLIELQADMAMFQHPLYEKSQNEDFLQTNQTLQTNHQL